MMSLVLLCLTVLSLFVGIFYVIRTGLINPSNKDFDSLLKIFLSLMLFQSILIYLEIVVPIALLYGPVHLSLHRISGQRNPHKYLYIQLIPFFFLSIFYCVLVYSEKIEAIWSESLLIYYPIHYLCIMLSTFGYGIYLWLTKIDLDYNQRQQQLVLQLATIAIVIGLFIAMLFSSKIVVNIDNDIIGFDPLYIVSGLLLLSIGVMISYLRTSDRERNGQVFEMLNSQAGSLVGDIRTDQVQIEQVKYNSFNIENDILKDYALIVEEAIDDKKLYLHTGLSLDSLSEETEIPKHHLSQVFNAYYGKTFYHYIAERRIKEAVSRIEEDENITLESLAYECGFNSKTSFNRYFKDFVGMTPSEYRANREVV